MDSSDNTEKNERKNTQDSVDTDCAQIIHDTVVNAYQIEWQRTHDIENKATGIVGFVGIIFSLTVATISSLIISTNENTKAKIFSESVFPYLIIFIILVLMISSIFLGIKALNVKKWWFLFADKFLEYCNNNEVTKKIVLEKITDDVAEGAKINSEQNDKIANYLKCSYTLFLISIIILASYLIYVIDVCR